jgi:hypothetical protein
VWFPLNVLLADTLRTYGRFFGDTLTVEVPTGSGNHVTLVPSRNSGSSIGRQPGIDTNARSAAPATSVAIRRLTAARAWCDTRRSPSARNMTS